MHKYLEVQINNSRWYTATILCIRYRLYKL